MQFAACKPKASTVCAFSFTDSISDLYGAVAKRLKTANADMMSHHTISVNVFAPELAHTDRAACCSMPDSYDRCLRMTKDGILVRG